MNKVLILYPELNRKFEPGEDRIVILTELPQEEGEKETFLAVMIDQEERPGQFVCYAHLGQHSVAHVGYLRDHCKAPEPKHAAQVEALKAELKQIGYAIAN